jgi:hypothetical protein
MGAIGKLNKWLLSGIFWLIITVLSLILLIVYSGRDSIFLYNNILAIIPTIFEILMAASFITYLLERRNKKQ